MIQINEFEEHTYVKEYFNIGAETNKKIKFYFISYIFFILTFIIIYFVKDISYTEKIINFLSVSLLLFSSFIFIFIMYRESLEIRKIVGIREVQLAQLRHQIKNLVYELKNKKVLGSEFDEEV